ncbi:MAG: hypothetical protein WCK07_07395 [Betaproteobacteria bacterium]
MNKTLMSLFLLCLSSLSIAGAIEQVEMEGQPNVILSSGLVAMCGMRLMLIGDLSVANENTVALTYDVSMSMGDVGQVLVKGLAFRVETQGQGAPKVTKLPLIGVWIKSENGKATIPNQGKVLTGEDNVSILYSDEKRIDKYVEFISSVSAKKPIMIGVRLNDGKDERIFSGIVKLSDKDSRAFSQCNIELVDLIKKQT